MPSTPRLPAEPASDSQVHVGRQAIFDARGGIAGYELLYRAAADATTAACRGTYATSQVILHAFTAFGLREVAGDRPCFIKLTREFVTGDLPIPFPPGPVVLEILESVSIDNQVISGILKLVDAGHRVALDDFVLGQASEQLLTVANFVKINVSSRDRDLLAQTVVRCRRYPNVRLIAECVETSAQLKQARRLRFDLFQGYALERAQVLSTGSVGVTRDGLLAAFGELSMGKVDTDRIISIVEADPALSRRILQVAGCTMPGRACSAREAVALVGEARVRQWIALILVSTITEVDDADLASILARARLCRTVGERLDVPGDVCFAVGLFSGIAELLDDPQAPSAAELGRILPLPPDVADALINGTGKLGRVLAAVRAYEARHMASASTPGGPTPTTGGPASAAVGSAATAVGAASTAVGAG